MQDKARLAAVICFAALALLIAGCGGSSSDETTDSGTESGAFRVGLEAPLSGEQAVLGQGMLKGAQLAAEQVNKKGGILGRKVKVVPIDDAADPETGVKAAEAAIEDGLDGVVGPYNSGVGIETLPLYVDDGLVPIRLTSDSSTNGLGYTLQPMEYQIAPVASQALTDWLHAKSVAIAYDPTQNYTVSVSKALKASLEEEGVEVTAYAKVKPGEKSYSGLVKELAAKHPDVIYSAVYFPEGGLIAKEMHESGVGSKCVADYASYDTGFVETAGVAAARACPVVGVPAPGDFDGSSESVRAYEEKFDQEPGTWSPYTYDSMNLLAEEIEIAGSADAGDLEEALDEVKGWVGWTGSVTIDPDNGNRDPATVVIADTDKSGKLHVDKSWAKAVGAPYSG
jgi:branched-chain amino acid transport system substrate-binding protein